MEVILTQDVEKLGDAGDIVTVKPGYGRNYLLPRGYALVASRGNIAQLEHHKRAIAASQAKLLVLFEHQRAGQVLLAGARKEEATFQLAAAIRLIGNRSPEKCRSTLPDNDNLCLTNS